jgi:hypothetical protein
LRDLLKNKLLAHGKQLASEAQKKLSNRGFTLFFQAPDLYLAAAVLTAGKYTIQDRENIFETLIQQGDKCAAFKEKMALLNMDNYHGHKLFVNGFKKVEEKAEASRKIHFKVWMEMVSKRRIIEK